MEKENIGQQFLDWCIHGSLVKQILVGIVLGVLFASSVPSIAADMGFLGKIFIFALKSVAPVLVFLLIASVISSHKVVDHGTSQILPVLVLYAIGTFAAAATAVLFSVLFPSTVELAKGANATGLPQGIGVVLENLVLSAVDNPVNAFLKTNYIGILVWAAAVGCALRYAQESTRQVFRDLSDCMMKIVRVIIRFAPIGVFGIICGTLATEGFSVMLKYLHLLAVLLSCMVFIVLVVNPFIVWWCSRENPYPLIFYALRESGITAFFTRSSAANIPVNLALCEKLKLDRETYGISIPLGATINTAGAAITITVLSMAAVHTLGIQIDFPTAVLLSLLASLGACGAAGVPGGSLMLIPLACSLFGISNDIAMQMVGVGFIIGSVQDSCETALNSSSDVIFTASALKRAERLKRGL